MKTKKQTVQNRVMKWEQQDPMVKLKTLAKALVLGLIGLLSSNQVTSQTNDTLPAVQIEKVKTEVSTKWWDFFMDPTYSPTDKVGTVRLSGGWSIHGVNVGGFLDLTGTQKNPADVESAFGRLNITKSTDAIIKGTSMWMTYVLNSSCDDKIFGNIGYKTKMGNWSLSIMGFPVSNKWFEASLFVGANQKFGKKIGTSAFVLTDFKAKGYYGETEATYKISKNIDALAQMRIGGTFTSKPKPSAYVWVRVRIQ